MEIVDLSYHFILENDVKVNSLSIVDLKDIVETPDEIKVIGKILFDIITFKNEEEKINKEEDLLLIFSKRKYPSSLDIALKDFDYVQEGNNLTIKVYFEVNEKSVMVEKICSIEEDELNFSLLDSLRRDKPNLNLNGEDIIIIDPLIKEEDIKIDNQKEEIQEVIVEPRNENITSKLEEKTVNENADKTIFKEKYSSSYLYYRLKRNETLDDVMKKFNVDKNELLKLNSINSFKENGLILIKSNV